MYTYDENSGVMYRTSDGLVVQPQTCTEEEFAEYQAYISKPDAVITIIPFNG